MHSRRSFSPWRLLIAAPRSGAENMARDTALQARAARTGETVFSIYSWSRPTLSFGRNQPAIGLYDLGKVRSAGLDVVRRPTGGRAILHHREVTYSVTAPLEDAAPLRETYSRINRILQSGLSRLGVTVVPATSSERAAVPSVRPCFETPAEGELVAQGGKLVGSAQYRDGGALLQHGSILVNDDQSSLPDFAARLSAESESVPAPATPVNCVKAETSPWVAVNVKATPTSSRWMANSESMFPSASAMTVASNRGTPLLS